MFRKIGNFCVILGMVLVLIALALFLYNRQEAETARLWSQTHLEQLVQILQETPPETVGEQSSEENRDAGEIELPNQMLQQIPKEFLTEAELRMTEVVIDGYSYIGYLSIPALGLELPVMADWDYGRLNVAPCRYYGTVRGENMVIMAHNYDSHFGPIAQLRGDETVTFVDMDGVVTQYRVAAVDILAPEAVTEMTAGVYDLTLFTCTYGGANRVTVYCNREK